MTKKLILLLATCLLVTSCLFGCGDDTKPSDDNPTTTSKVESTTKEDVATTEPTTEYVYKGEEFFAEKSLEKYFSGLVLEKGDIIHLNEIYSEDSLDGSTSRGSIAYALLTALNMKDERDSFKVKYLPEGAYTPEVPYKDNYSIKYDGKKVQFVLVEKAVDGISFDVVPME